MPKKKSAGVKKRNARDAPGTGQGNDANTRSKGLSSTGFYNQHLTFRSPSHVSSTPQPSAVPRGPASDRLGSVNNAGAPSSVAAASPTVTNTSWVSRTSLCTVTGAGKSSTYKRTDPDKAYSSEMSQMRQTHMTPTTHINARQTDRSSTTSQTHSTNRPSYAARSLYDGPNQGFPGPSFATPRTFVAAHNENESQISRDRKAVQHIYGGATMPRVSSHIRQPPNQAQMRNPVPPVPAAPRAGTQRQNSFGRHRHEPYPSSSGRREFGAKEKDAEDFFVNVVEKFRGLAMLPEQETTAYDFNVKNAEDAEEIPADAPTKGRPVATGESPVLHDTRRITAPVGALQAQKQIAALEEQSFASHNSETSGSLLDTPVNFSYVSTIAPKPSQNVLQSEPSSTAARATSPIDGSKWATPKQASSTNQEPLEEMRKSKWAPKDMQIDTPGTIAPSQVSSSGLAASRWAVTSTPTRDSEKPSQEASSGLAASRWANKSTSTSPSDPFALLANYRWVPTSARHSQSPKSPSTERGLESKWATANGQVPAPLQQFPRLVVEEGRGGIVFNSSELGGTASDPNVARTDNTSSAPNADARR